jgi:hypothetical protein
MTSTDRVLLYALIGIATIALLAGMMAFMEWRLNRRRSDAREEERLRRDEVRHDEDLARAQQAERAAREMEERRLEMERSRISADNFNASRAEKIERDRFIATNSGAGSGGYVLIDVPDADRSLFHDLAKGFEDYAHLKGYSVSFSIDNSWEGRTAYKFTVIDRGVSVGSEQVRKDFKEYAERVRHDDDDFEDMPVITNMAEHSLMVTMLKNRVVFFRANYKAYKNTVAHLEKLISSNQLFPALPQPPIYIYNNGATVDTRNYNANNSQRLIQGENNAYTDSSINIGGSLNERQQRVTALDEVIAELKTQGEQTEQVARIERELMKVRDELTEYEKPDESAIRKWLEYAKNSMTMTILGYEMTEAAHKLWQLFGM